MTRPTIIADDETRRAIDAMLLRICDAHGVWLSHIVGQRKTTAVCAARKAALSWMRIGVRMRRVSKSVVHLGLESHYAGYKSWVEPSYPVLAEILGTDHSTLVLMMHRKPRDTEPKRRPKHVDPTPEEIEAAKAGMRV